MTPKDYWDSFWMLSQHHPSWDLTRVMKILDN